MNMLFLVILCKNRLILKKIICLIFLKIMAKYCTHKSKYANKKQCFMFFRKKILNPIQIENLLGQSKPGLVWHLNLIN